MLNSLVRIILESYSEIQEPREMRLSGNSNRFRNLCVRLVKQVELDIAESDFAVDCCRVLQILLVGAYETTSAFIPFQCREPIFTAAAFIPL